MNTPEFGTKGYGIVCNASLAYCELDKCLVRYGRDLDIESAQGWLDEIMGLVVGQRSQFRKEMQELYATKLTVHWLKRLKKGEAVYIKDGKKIAKEIIAGATSRIIYIKKEGYMDDPFFFASSPYRKFRRTDGAELDGKKGKLVDVSV